MWAGEFNEEPLTAAWVIIPTLKKMQVLAYEGLWFDEPGDATGARTSTEPQLPDAGDVEPEVNITIKAAPRRTGENRAG